MSYTGCNCPQNSYDNHKPGCARRLGPTVIAAATPQPAPTGNGQPVLELVIADLQARSEMGRAKYGTVLRIHNGRDAEMDAYQEQLDGVMYFKQSLLEREDLRARILELETTVSRLEREVTLLRRDARA